MTKPTFLPYGRQNITDDDIQTVTAVLRSDWLTQGPAVPEFEDALADITGASECVACSSGTAALHLAVLALGLGDNDAIITTPNTFLASANCARYVGADVLFADIDPETGLINPESVARLFEHDSEHRIRAVIPVHFAGQPADLPALASIARQYGAKIIDDACHAIGATYDSDGQTFKLGNNPHSDLTVFSFHPVKHVAMGEGGAVTTDDPELAEKMRRFRNHGIVRDRFENESMASAGDGRANPWYHEMSEPGFNYRLTDIQAALGRSQLKRLPESLARRREIAETYHHLLDEKFAAGEIRPLELLPNVNHAWHLFVVRIDFERLGISRAVVMNQLRAQGIGTQVHYIPVHLQPYYQKLGSPVPGALPGVEKYYAGALSLPMYPELTEADCRRIVEELERILNRVATHA
ncbi:MAG: UDP-4-amino-4,6-dideoxy-N-acetyl-beta-L-altrosamine transaminase [FCB group bacterium]|nr:UDP-4-amino-4,6-dideoxy-N-acetyl-beta-L-altrosamine transaminase [FCB group bacterium]